MILTCPSCSAQYFAEDESIGASGRTVRCAACSHAWFAQPELSLEEEINASDLSREKVERMRKASAAPGDVAPHQAYRAKEMARKRNGSKVAALAAWGGTAAVFLAVGATAILKRDDVVRAFPEASSAYAMAGLDVNRFGVEFTDVSADRIFDGTTPVLTIVGGMVNVTKKVQPVPNVRVDLLDDGGQGVESVLIMPEEMSIQPGAVIEFSSRLDSPSLAAYEMAVTFVDSDDSLRLVAPEADIESHDAETHDVAPAHAEENVVPDEAAHDEPALISENTEVQSTHHDAHDVSPAETGHEPADEHG